MYNNNIQIMVVTDDAADVTQSHQQSTSIEKVWVQAIQLVLYRTSIF